MSDVPLTRATLLRRVRDRDDQQAWGEFVEIYAPLVYRYARRQGLQDADAADVTQDVLRVAARSLPAFRYDPARGRFRGWLLTVTRNEIRDWLAARQRQASGSGSTTLHARLDEHPAPTDDETWETEYRRRLLQWAADRVRADFQDSTWRAFEQTALDGRSAADVAAELGLSVGAVYIAKSRVLARLRQEVEHFVGENL